MASTEPTTTAGQAPAAQPKLNRYPFWSPRFWHGMRWGHWLKLLFENRCQVHPLRLPMVVAITCITPFNTVMGWFQQLWYGRRIAAVSIRQPPVFIIGHWRSGTTLLHELLVNDDRFTYSTTFQCFAPHHCLLTEGFFTRFGAFLLPKQRPMDNMTAGWSLPQEDEFALLTMGAPTPYRRMAFPNRAAPCMEFLDMRDLDPDDLQRWKSAMLQFARIMTFQNSKRIVFKSPPHTGRVGELNQLFPGASFVHIARHPDTIFASTRRLWQALDEVQGCQLPRHRELDEYVFACFERMYAGFEAQRAQIDARRICELRYEDLVADPIGQVQRIYETLEWGDFERVRPALQAYCDGKQDYRPNKHPDLSPEIRAEIRRRWSGYFDRYGYEK